MEPLSDKNVLITGAGSGIGRLMAHYFADEQANVVLVDINEQAVKSVAREVADRNVRASYHLCNIADRKEVEQTSQRILRDFGPIDILVNNAGMVVGKSFFDITLEEMERTMNINFWGHLFFTKALIGDMIARKGGAIVNVASSSGLIGMPMLSAYAASKFAEVGFSEALRRELKKFGHKGITVTCVCPYIIDTGMFKGFKPMLLSPILKPEYAARKIVEGAKKGKPYVMLPPHSLYSTLVLKLLPTHLFDWLLKMSGAERAMDCFEGRKSC